MTRFILDGRHIQDHFPGIGRYLFDLAVALARIAKEERIRVISAPGLVNTRYDINALASRGDVELAEVAAKPWSVREQLLGLNRPIIAGAELWHSGYYVMPYALPVPVVLTMEDVLPLILPETMPNPSKRFLYRSLNLLAVRRATHVVAISRAASEDIKRILGVPPARITVIPLAVNVEFHPRGAVEINSLQKRLGLPERYVLYLGSNKPHKNLVRLLRAWAKVTYEMPLVIAGHWDARFPEAKRLADDPALTGRVLFRHNVSTDDVPILLCGAQAFVFPSLYEGFGLPPLEAMACGTPVVCSESSSLPEVAGDAAFLFDPSDVDSIASALTSVIQDAGLRGSLIVRGLARSQSFSWDQTAQMTLAVYRRVISHHQA